MLIVAGTSLSNLNPYIWDANSPYYLPNLKAIMVSYADFLKHPGKRRSAMKKGLHDYLGIPNEINIYLDNGSFYLLRQEGISGTTDGHCNEEDNHEKYEEFVREARPDWWPIPQDYIPTPSMTAEEQQQCFRRTMEVNLAYHLDGFVPVVHVSRYLEAYTGEFQAHKQLAAKPAIALGGIVPNLLRRPKAVPYSVVLESLRHVRKAFAGKQIHVFGIGGTATLHIAALLGMDSVDSSGWRNRAARGIVQLPGSGDRMIVELGSWRARRLSSEELRKLEACPCPGCQDRGVSGLRLRGTQGFCNRATHNLWVLLKEAEAIEEHLTMGTYRTWYQEHLDNTTYLPLIMSLVGSRTDEST